MLNTRMTVIIREFLKTEAPVTSEYLAKVLDVTSRTVRNDIKELESIVVNFGGSIKSIRGTGYQLLVHDDHLFRQLLQEITDKDKEKDGDIPTLPEERVHYLLTRLLFADGYVKLEDMADKLFISRSTIQNDLRDVKDIFCKYGIKLDKRPNFGLKVMGEEFQLRLCMAEHIFKNIDTEEIEGTALYSEESLNIIRKIIIEQIKVHHIVLSDIGLNNLVIHIAIAFNRIKNQKYITLYPKDLMNLKDQKQYQVAEEIVAELEKELEVNFPETEVAYITIHLLGTKMIRELHFNVKEIQGMIDQTIYQTVYKILETIDKELQLNIKGDQELFVALCLHLKPAIHRLHYGIDLPNPLLDDIKSKYPHAFQAAIIAGMVLKREHKVDIHENELGYLALHLGAAMENKKLANQSKKCMIVCASGVGSARLLASKIQSKFGSKVEIIGTTDYYKINQIPFHNLDFLISTIPISLNLPLPVIHVNTILGGSDLEKIEKLLLDSGKPKFKYIREELVFLQKDFETREEVLKFLADQAQSLGLVNEEFLPSILEREKFSPTSYGNFVAIPHPISPLTDTTFWAICTLQKPIEWGGKRVQFVCLLNVEKDSTEELQVMYDLLVSVIDNIQMIQQLIKCKTFKEFAAVFKKE